MLLIPEDFSNQGTAASECDRPNLPQQQPANLPSYAQARIMSC